MTRTSVEADPHEFRFGRNFSENVENTDNPDGAEG
jgi:hypothetical protein